jgi:hypothetical protein
MDTKLSNSLEGSLARLAEMDAAHLELGTEMFNAHGGVLYGMDLLASGALNRSKAHIAGFRTLIKAKNLICAGALLRLQLDTAMRFFAAFLVEKPHDFAIAVLGGKRVRDLRDRNGEAMTDAYLVRKLGEEFDWVPRVYERTSGYVHFSSTHMMSALTPKDGDAGEGQSLQFEIKVAAKDKPLPQWIYIETSDAFCAATEIFLRYVHGWVFTKANPELVEKRKRECSENAEGA